MTTCTLLTGDGFRPAAVAAARDLIRTGRLETPERILGAGLMLSATLALDLLRPRHAESRNCPVCGHSMVSEGGGAYSCNGCGDANRTM